MLVPSLLAVLLVAAMFLTMGYFKAENGRAVPSAEEEERTRRRLDRIEQDAKAFGIGADDSDPT